jgi:hypothetical protein
LQRAKAVGRDKATAEQRWIQSLAMRLPFGKVLVAIARIFATSKTISAWPGG